MIGVGLPPKRGETSGEGSVLTSMAASFVHHFNCNL